MAHLSCSERLRVIKIYNSVKKSRFGNGLKTTQTIARESYNIKISLTGIKNLIKKWKIIGAITDLPRPNLHLRLINDAGLLAINKQLL